MGWPALVILGQLGLQAFGWGFLATVKYRGQLALPFSAAHWAGNNPHILTLVATLISTLLAACSSLYVPTIRQGNLSLMNFAVFSLMHSAGRSLFIFFGPCRWPHWVLV
jgi:hypothetical protein